MNDRLSAKKAETNQVHTDAVRSDGTNRHARYATDLTRLPLYTQVTSPLSWLYHFSQVQVSQSASQEITNEGHIVQDQREANISQDSEILRLQRKAVSGSSVQEEQLGSRIRAAKKGGQPLDVNAKRTLEQGLGVDLSDVRVHIDSEADRLSHAVDALAFTTGSDMFFRQGAYSPNSAEGLHLLTHEATHVVQQSAGPVSGIPLRGGVYVSDPGDRFERAAELSANRAMAKSSPIASSTRQGISKREGSQGIPIYIQRVYIYQPGRGIVNEPDLTDDDLAKKKDWRKSPGDPAVWYNQLVAGSADFILAYREFRQNKTPLTGYEVGAILNVSRFVQDNVVKIADSRFSDDNVKIIDDNDFFNKFYVTHFADRDHKGNKQDALEYAKKANGYYVPGEDAIFIRLTGQLTDTIHEALHALTDPSYRKTLGRDVNEGTTELFNQLVAQEFKLKQQGTYEKEVAFVEKLISFVGRNAIARAYFHGDYSELKSSLDEIGNNYYPSAYSTYDIWIGYLQENRLILPDDDLLREEKKARLEGYKNFKAKEDHLIEEGMKFAEDNLSKLIDDNY